MERRNKKAIPVINKIEIKIKDKEKDGGDTKAINKTNNTSKIKNGVKIVYPEEDSKKIAKIIYPDGDSKKVTHSQRFGNNNTTTQRYLDPRVEQKPRQQLVKPPVPPKEESKPRVKLPQELQKEMLVKRLQDLKKIRDRYTTRLKPIQNTSVQEEGKRKEGNKKDDKFGITKVEEKNVTPVEHKKIEETLKDKEKTIEPNKETLDTKVKKDASQKRNPLVKTITARNGSVKVYKAVTFVEQKQLTPLQIKIPDVIHKKSSKIDTHSLKSKATISKVSIKEKDVVTRKTHKKRAHKHRKYRPASGETFTDCRCRSPPTEVARWVPACINTHNKPYYEAWVDTTLAATSKYTSKEKQMYEKKTFLKNLGRTFERPSSPELVYSKCDDERYTGRIRITQR